jgi:uncharacterized membrane protein
MWIFTVAVLLAPLMIVAVSIPMAMRRVPPNQFYGFRTAKTMSDERIWYEANQKAGINLIVAGLLTVALWGVLRMTAGVLIANAASIPLMLLLLFGCVAVSLVQLSKM